MDGQQILAGGFFAGAQNDREEENDSRGQMTAGEDLD